MPGLIRFNILRKLKLFFVFALQQLFYWHFFLFIGFKKEVFFFSPCSNDCISPQVKYAVSTSVDPSLLGKITEVAELFTDLSTLTSWSQMPLSCNTTPCLLGLAIQKPPAAIVSAGRKTAVYVLKRRFHDLNE